MSLPCARESGSMTAIPELMGCRGTESPLLALNMIAKAIKVQHGLTLSFDHVFSCEIEPFKQAYIERNFSPPVLFRDVTELGKKKAHTAYGSLVDVPGNVDVSERGERS